MRSLRLWWLLSALLLAAVPGAGAVPPESPKVTLAALEHDEGPLMPERESLQLPFELTWTCSQTELLGPPWIPLRVRFDAEVLPADAAAYTGVHLEQSDFQVPRASPERCLDDGFRHTVRTGVTIVLGGAAPAFVSEVLRVKATIDPAGGIPVDPTPASHEPWGPYTADVAFRADYDARFAAELTGSHAVRVDRARPAATYGFRVENLANGPSRLTTDLASTPPDGLTVVTPAQVVLDASRDGRSGPDRTVEFEVRGDPTLLPIDSWIPFTLALRLQSDNVEGADEEVQQLTYTFLIHDEYSYANLAPSVGPGLALAVVPLAGLLLRRRR